MIEKVRVQNFQSLGDTTVELGKALTVIVGPNDEGKSAFFRAVRFASEAQAGTDFIKRGHKVTKVTIWIDGRELVWEKGAQVNKYYLDGVVFDRVGKQIPPDLEEFLSMSSVEFDKDLKLNLNFADQEDPPFLIPFPGGITTSKVAKVLGDLTNLSVLFKAVGEANVRRKREEGEAKVREVDVRDHADRLGQFDALEDREAHVSAIEAALEEIPPLQSRIVRYSEFRDERERLRSTHELLQAQKSAIPPDLSAELAEIEVLFDRVSILRNRRDEKESLARTHASIGNEKELANEQFKLAEESLELLIQELGVCPLCGSKFDGSTTDHRHAEPAQS